MYVCMYSMCVCLAVHAHTHTRTHFCEDRIKSVKKLYNRLFNVIATLKMGITVIQMPNQAKQLHMPCFKLHNPRRIMVTELTKLGGGDISLEHGRFDVELGKPVKFIELMEISNKLQLVGAYAGSDFELAILQVEQNLTSLRVMTVTGVEARLAVPVKQAVKLAKDAAMCPLDQSIRDITHPQQPPRRRARKKTADGRARGQSESNTSDAVIEELGSEQHEDDDEDDDADIVEEDDRSLNAQSSQAPGNASSSAKRPSFFYAGADLGVLRYDLNFKRQSKCFFCSQPVACKQQIRAVYAYHSRRPHAYLHMECMSNLEAKFVPTAISKLEEVAASLESPKREVANATLASLRSKL